MAHIVSQWMLDFIFADDNLRATWRQYLDLNKIIFTNDWASNYNSYKPTAHFD